MDLNRIEREKIVVAKMIALYCRHKLGFKEMPKEYIALVDYAHIQLDRCKFGDSKSSCEKCPIHCYKPDMRNKIREVMRWSGPRMIIYAPFALIRHIFNL